jgi:hypothetical protein
MRYSDSLKVAQTLAAKDYSAASTNGTGVDTLGFTECLVVFNAGLATTSAELDIHIEESADNSSFTDITDAEFGQVTAANDNTTYQGRIDLIGRKRYLRAVAATDGSNAAAGSVDFVLLGASSLPVSPANTEAFNV